MQKILKHIRYLPIGIILLFFIAIIGLIFYAGILALKNSPLGILPILFGLLLLSISIIKLREHI